MRKTQPQCSRCRTRKLRGPPSTPAIQVPEPSTTTWILSAATLLVGYATKSLSDWLQHRRTAQRELASRAEQRNDQLRLRRAEFQRTTLLELQDAALKLARAAGAANYHDIMSLRRTGKWQSELLPEQLSEELRLAQAATGTLAVRVRDEKVRQLIPDLKDQTVASALAGDETAARVALTNMTFIHTALNERIGELLRKLDDAEDESDPN